MKERAAEDYRTDLIVWSQLAPHTTTNKRPPKPPSVLMER